MISKIPKKQYIVSTVLALITYVALCGQKVLPLNNFLAFLLIIPLIKAYLKTDFTKIKRGILVFSLIISFILVFGRILYNFRYSNTYSSFKELFRLKSLLYIIGNFSFIYSILDQIIPKLIGIKIKNEISIKKHPFLIPFIVILSCYILYFIIYYPGILSNDSLLELNMILGNETITDHHTIIHFLFMKIPYELGYYITHSKNIAVSFISITQMIVVSTIYASMVNFINKRNAPKFLVYISIIYFALIPMHGFYSITMWKDIIFSALCLLLTTELYKLVEKKQITIKNSYSFIIVSLLTVFFRNNAIYMYYILAITSLYVFRKQLKTIVLMLLIVFGTYYIVKGPVYKYFKIKTSSSAEYIAIPLQQIGRMAYKNVTFTQSEKEMINKLIPIDELKNSYNPEIVDSIKFNKKYNVSVFDNNKLEYLKLWANLCIKHPAIAIESYLTSTLGYWYPNVEYWTSLNQIDKNDIGVYQITFIPSSIKEKVTRLASREVPLIGNTWCIAACFYIIIISSYITVKRNRKRYLYLFVPVFGIWLTMMVATPVFAEFRYVYSAFTCLPFLISVPYLTNNPKKMIKNSTL